MKRAIITLAILCVPFGFVACGSNNNGSSTTTASAVSSYCSAGYVYTQYGCETQCATNPSYGNYGGGTCNVMAIPETYNSCPAGQVMTQYNCQTVCASNPSLANYNGGTCNIAATSTSTYPYGTTTLPYNTMPYTGTTLPFNNTTYTGTMPYTGMPYTSYNPYIWYY